MKGLAELRGHQRAYSVLDAAPAGTQLSAVFLAACLLALSEAVVAPSAGPAGSADVAEAAEREGVSGVAGSSRSLLGVG